MKPPARREAAERPKRHNGSAMGQHLADTRGQEGGGFMPHCLIVLEEIGALMS